MPCRTDVAEILLLRGVQYARLFRGQEVCKTDHRVQRLAQVVGDRGCECFQLPVGGSQLAVGVLELGVAFGNAVCEGGILESQVANRHGALEHRHDGAEVEWLQDVVQGTALHGLHGGVDGPVPGHDDSDQVRVHGLGGAQQLHTVHTGHEQIGNQDVVPGGPQMLQRFLTAGRAGWLVTFVTQGPHQGKHLCGLVIDDQDSCALAHAVVRLSSGTGWAVSSARVVRNSARRGGLPSMRSTFCGTSCSARNR